MPLCYNSRMQIHTIQVGTFGVNCAFVENEGKVLVIDPGQEADRIIGILGKNDWTPEAILLTHGHFDHINGIPGLLKRFPDLPVYVSKEDAEVMSHPMNTLPPEYAPVKVGKLKSWEVEKFEKWRIKVIPTPGHTPGGVCYYLPKEKLLLSGDTLFAGSIGRTDLPGGDMATLMRSLDSLRALPEDTVVIPGHGMTTTIGRELASNPFLQ